MKRTSKLATGMVAFALILGASFVGSASAAVTLGSTCTGDDFTGSVNFNPTLGTASSSGVITSWGANFVGLPPNFPMGVLVVEPTGAPNEWRIVNRGPLAAVNSGSFQTAVRIPVSAGQTVGFYGIVPVCGTFGVTMLYGDLEDMIPTVGETFPAVDSPNTTVAGWAKVEPDSDVDGFGDETQDKCTLSKLTAGLCVAVKPAATQVPAKNAFKLLLTADLNSTATATGTVKLPKTKKSKAKTLTFTSKAQPVVPGSIALISLSYPAKLKSALARLSKSKSLKLAIAVSVDGPLDGTFDTAVLNYSQKLKGTAKQ